MLFRNTLKHSLKTDGKLPNHEVNTYPCHDLLDTMYKSISVGLKRLELVFKESNLKIEKLQSATSKSQSNWHLF